MNTKVLLAGSVFCILQIYMALRLHVQGLIVLSTFSFFMIVIMGILAIVFIKLFDSATVNTKIKKDNLFFMVTGVAALVTVFSVLTSEWYMESIMQAKIVTSREYHAKH